MRFKRWWRMSSESTVTNMWLEIVLAQLVAEWFRVIGFVCTHMLQWIFVLWTWQDWMLKQVHHYQMIIDVGRRNVNSQRCSSLIHPQMTFRAQFGSIGGIGTSEVTAQRGSYRLAVHRLPAPLNMAFLMIVFQHRSIHLLPHTRLIPTLKAGMQTAASSKPFLPQAFPLTATPQHKQDPVQHLAVWQSRASSTPHRFFRRQNPFNPFPQ